MLKALKIHEMDNVAVVLGNVEKGEDVILSNESAELYSGERYDSSLS